MFGFKSVLSALTLLALGAASVDAELPYKLGKPVFFGSGCPAGTVAVVPSTDGRTLSVLFSDFSSKTKGSANLREYKACNLAVPMDIQPGFTAAIAKVDYRGNAYVPAAENATAEFSAEYFFAGSSGPELRTKYGAGYDGNIYLSDNVATLAWSRCGASTIFRVNTQLTASKPSGVQDDVQISIDTADNRFGGFYYQINYKAC
ncbi:hypothetical protein ATCC90586_005104 [Pythium insidiosum]|nr:hypothetical protein ATCC90586_005104 [Pythium insidiosum]